MAITMGDPAGIGPEIVAKALLERPALRHDVVVIGDLAVLQQAGHVVLPAFPGASLNWRACSNGALQAPDTGSGDHGVLHVVEATSMAQPVRWGHVSADHGRAAADCIRWAAQAALCGDVRAIVTAPIHKEALAAAGEPYPGHTEMLQALAAEHLGWLPEQLPVRMMLSAPGLCTVLVSIHVALRQALDAVTVDSVLSTLRITAAHFQRLGMPAVRIAVAGLNPHAGEGGLFGREEIEVIRPAVEWAQREGLLVTGPHAPDTVFMRARQGEFDLVLAMYHDQGLIPVKLLGLEHGVNTTLGLPFVRTSPDHGTAFDLAGTGQASAASLLAAIDAADSATRISKGQGG
jgi:4-hydroxythreonine-4-phosphate dehydrogenase